MALFLAVRDEWLVPRRLVRMTANHSSLCTVGEKLLFRVLEELKATGRAARE